MSRLVGSVATVCRREDGSTDTPPSPLQRGCRAVDPFPARHLHLPRNGRERSEQTAAIKGTADIEGLALRLASGKGDPVLRAPAYCSVRWYWTALFCASAAQVQKSLVTAPAGLAAVRSIFRDEQGTAVGSGQEGRVWVGCWRPLHFGPALLVDVIDGTFLFGRTSRSRRHFMLMTLQDIHTDGAVRCQLVIHRRDFFWPVI